MLVKVPKIPKSDKNPYNLIVSANLNRLFETEKEQVILKNLKSLNKKFSSEISFRAIKIRSSLSLPTFIKFMIATNQDEFTIKISDILKQEAMKYDLKQIKLAEEASNKSK